MINEQRRSPRYEDYLPACAYAIDGLSSTTLAGPFSTRILDISRHGARLFMNQVLFGHYHFFYSTLSNDSRFIKLVITLPETSKEIDIATRPIWQEMVHHKNLSAYLIGVDFIHSPSGKFIQELDASLSKKREIRVAKWHELCDSCLEKKGYKGLDRQQLNRK